MWSMNDWNYLERQVVRDPKGREWVVALMDVLGQEGDPDMPGQLLEAQYASGRFFAMVFNAQGTAIQREQGFPTLEEGTTGYERLLAGVVEGTIDPTQPAFRADLED
jgi:hypothetical protein